MEQSRRDFLKVFGKATAGLGLVSLTGVPSPSDIGGPNGFSLRRFRGDRLERDS